MRLNISCNLERLTLNGVAYEMTYEDFVMLERVLRAQILLMDKDFRGLNFNELPPGETWILPAPEGREKIEQALRRIRIKAIRALGTGQVKVRLDGHEILATRKVVK